MARFKYTDNSQSLIIAVNLKEQLLPETLEWTINYLIDKADLSLFEDNYHNDKKGAAAYHPGLLLKAVLYCYSRGILSSRKIEKACRDNMIVKALAEDKEPDHDTIAAFISSNSEQVKDLYTQILLKCAQLGLITGEMFAFDGCKMPSNAAKEWSGTIKELEKKRDKLSAYIGRIIVRHKEMDKDEKTKKIQGPYKKTMGDDRERRERSVERLERKLEKLNKFLETAEPRKGVSGQEVQSNITDNESALIKSPHGYIQGYNGIAVTDSGNQIIIEAEAIGSGAESGCFPEMLGRLEVTMKVITGKEKPLKKALVEGDTGYFSEENLQEASRRGINVLIPDQQFRQRDPYFSEKKKEKVPKKRYGPEDFKYNKKKDSYICPCGKVLEYKGDIELRNNEGKKYQARRGVCVKCPKLDRCVARRTSKNPFRTLYVIDRKYEKNLSEKMRKKIDNPAYRELYSRRMQIAEPVFADMTYCKGMDRFTLRTNKKVNIQWKLYCMVHNMGKCVKPLGEMKRK
jgi:transposase